MFNFFKLKKSFQCGGEHCINILDKDSGARSKIYYKQPTGEQLLDFAHASLSFSKNELIEFQNKFEELNEKQLHKLTIERLFIPAAEQIITRFEGYVNSNGEEITTLEGIKEYFPHHLQKVAELAFRANEVSKKKF